MAENEGEIGEEIEGGGEALLWEKRDGKEREKLVGVCVFCFFLFFFFELPAGDRKNVAREERKRRKRERKRGKKRK